MDSVLDKDVLLRNIDGPIAGPENSRAATLAIALIEIREAIGEQNELLVISVQIQQAQLSISGELLALQRGRMESLRRHVTAFEHRLQAVSDTVQALAWKYGHLVKEGEEPIIPADVRELKNDTRELANKLDAFEQALQGVITHQGETAKLVQDLADMVTDQKGKTAGPG